MENFNLRIILLSSLCLILSTTCHARSLPSRLSIDQDDSSDFDRVLPLESPPIDNVHVQESIRVKRGAAYPGGHGDFSGVAKQSTFAALGTYGGYLGHGKGSTAGGYGAGSGRNGLDAAGGITISGALGSYGGYLGHKGPTVISSGGFGNGGLLFGKI